MSVGRFFSVVRESIVVTIFGDGIAEGQGEVAWNF
jgi:hypothetical protein